MIDNIILDVYSVLMNLKLSKLNNELHGSMPENFQDKSLFAALDLGTNSCRMLIAEPVKDDFRVIDSFSKTVFLGQDMDTTGLLSSAAIRRTISALKICKRKLQHHKVKHMKLVATAACRQARNGKKFINRVRRETSLVLEIIPPKLEACFAVNGSATHLRPQTDYVLIIDIGGGSTELVMLDLTQVPHRSRSVEMMRLDGTLGSKGTSNIRVLDWISIPYGVTTLRDQYSDILGDKDRYAIMSWYFEECLSKFMCIEDLKHLKSKQNFQIIGTSGTLTTIAATHLNLPRYDRASVDGCQLTTTQVDTEISRYLSGGGKWRESNPCIGQARKELIMSGAAILQAILRVWPTDILTIADRGLREGILYSLMVRKGYFG